MPWKMDLGLILAGGIIEAKVSLLEGNGGAAGTRTPYLFNAIEALSQMSYSPTRAGNVQPSGCSFAAVQHSKTDL